MEKFFGFNSYKSMRASFNMEYDADFPTEEQILFAVYDQPPYEGYSYVIFQKDGKLFDNAASHCSCRGLEEGWGPQETTWKAIANFERLWHMDIEERRALGALVAENLSC